MTKQQRPSVPGAPAVRFESADHVMKLLTSVGYLADKRMCDVLWLADQLGKPVLIEGPAGTGKTELAKSIALVTDSRLIRLQCYEGLDEGRALYEWNYQKQLLRILADSVGATDDVEAWSDLEPGIFTEAFLMTRPLLDAIRAEEPVVLLLDEVDRLDIEAEALLLEVLSDYQISIPELGTVTGNQIPTVFLTCNNSRDLSEALRRRCLYLHIDYPTPERERDIVRTRVPGISEDLAAQITALVASFRQSDVQRHQSKSPTLEWATTLLSLGAAELDAEFVAESRQILRCYRDGIDAAASHRALRSESGI